MEAKPVVVKSIFIYPIKACKGVSLDTASICPTGFKWDRHWTVINSKGRMLTQRVNPELALVDVSLPPEAVNGPWVSHSPDCALNISAPGMGPLHIPLAPAKPLSKVENASVWEWTGDALDEGPAAAEWFTKYLGKPCRLIRFDSEKETRKTDPAYADGFKTTFTDGYPFLVISQASLDALNKELPIPFPIKRFRPNIFVDGCEPFAEDLWKTVNISGLTFHGVKLCSRCKVTTVDPDTAEMGEEPLKTMQNIRSGKVMSLSKGGAKVFMGQNLVCDECLKITPTDHKSVKVGDVVTVVDTWPKVSENLV